MSEQVTHEDIKTALRNTKVQSLPSPPERRIASFFLKEIEDLKQDFLKTVSQLEVISNYQLPRIEDYIKGQTATIENILKTAAKTQIDIAKPQVIKKTIDNPSEPPITTPSKTSIPVLVIDLVVAIIEALIKKPLKSLVVTLALLGVLTAAFILSLIIGIKLLNDWGII